MIPPGKLTYFFTIDCKIYTSDDEPVEDVKKNSDLWKNFNIPKVNVIPKVESLIGCGAIIDMKF
jgi:hypothetical protein